MLQVPEDIRRLCVSYWGHSTGGLSWSQVRTLLSHGWTSLFSHIQTAKKHVSGNLYNWCHFIQMPPPHPPEDSTLHNSVPARLSVPCCFPASQLEWSFLLRWVLPEPRGCSAGCGATKPNDLESTAPTRETLMWPLPQCRAWRRWEGLLRAYAPNSFNLYLNN